MRSTAALSRETVNDVFVAAGRSVLIDCAKPVERVSVGLGDLAEAIAVSRFEILLNGKAPGDTSLIIWEQGGSRQFFNVKIRPAANDTTDRLEGIRRQLNEQLPGQDIKVGFENGAIFLSGTARDLNSSTRAIQIASAIFAKEKHAEVHDLKDSNHAISIDSADGKVVNLLNVQVPEAEPQILLKVVFASVDRNQSKSLGANLFSTGFGNMLGGTGTGQFPAPPWQNPIPPNSAVNVANALNIFAFSRGLNLGATIQALEAKGLVQVLSEPNVLAENGKQASFLAGGEYPYPVVQGSTGTSTGPTVTIQFKEYGVRLNFIPTITPRGTIRLQVAPEVSSLDFTSAVTISGFQIPAIAVRKVNTEIELQEGQSFAIGGLLDNRETQTLSKIPYISNVPILGKFFQSISKTKNNTELIVIVTPEFVDPIKAGEPLPHLKFPTEFLPPNSNIPMHTPDAKPAGSAPAQPAQAIPVEQLIESMQPEKPLVIDSSYGGGSSSGGGSGGGSPR